jgi:hypothetical protein
VTAQLPIGRGHAWLSNIPRALDLAIGGWQYSAVAKYYSGRPLLFNTSYVVSGDPKVDNSTRDRWFDTGKFAVADTFTPRSNPWYFAGLNGPGHVRDRHDADQDVQLVGRYRMEARVEAYNALNNVVWDNPDPEHRQRELRQGDAQATGVERPRVQFGLRFVF